MLDSLKNNFVKPSDEFTPMPFWFWNDALSNKEITRQIHEMYEKGVMGFVIHPRIGIPQEITYMSDQFLSYVKCAVTEAHRLGMKVILYDEAMYPSGSAHGMVVEHNQSFASRGLKVVEANSYTLPDFNEGETLVCTLTAEKVSQQALNHESIQILQHDKIPENHVVLFFIEGFTNGHIRGIHFGEDDGENPPKSADLLNPESVQTFISFTHERYYDALSEYFGDTIIGIFTDEPSMLGRYGDEQMRPWTDGFLQTFLDNGNKITDLPALWYDVGDHTGGIHKKYNKAIYKKLVESYYQPIFEWCEVHGIALAGHPQHPDDIGLLKYFHIPGQDLIFRHVAPEDEKALLGAQSTQAKCSSDAARHYGKRRNLNECFACCGKNEVEWSFQADDMKWMMDWLFIRGVNLLVPHAFYYSVDGERRFGERPPDVGPNNIWWKYYDRISSYIKRMSYMMTDNYNTAETAVLCEVNVLPYQITKPLYENQIEFNYLEADLLDSDKCIQKDGMIMIENQKYTTLVIENITLLTERVYAFARMGGTVIAYNPEHQLLDSSITSITSMEQVTSWTAKDLIITPAHHDLRVSHIVKEEEHFYVLTNEGEHEIEGNIQLLTSETIEVWDAWNGTCIPYQEGNVTLERRQSVILHVGRHPNVRKEIYLGEHNKMVRRETQLIHWTVNGEPVPLISWTEWPQAKEYCGTIAYQTTFEIHEMNYQEVILHLGEVGEMAEVTLNDKFVGFQLWAPYVFNITDAVRLGKNTLSISITNSLANKYTEHLQKSGLLGKVVLHIR